MRLNLDKDTLSKIKYLVGDMEMMERMATIPVKPLFDGDVCTFLNALSKELMADADAKQYPDIIAFAFWIRRASLLQLQERFEKKDGNPRFGRGIAFHIAPSNVPVNFAYSLAAGLLTGNANIVRLPSREFRQVDIIVRVVRDLLVDYESMKYYICLVRYGKEKEVNSLLSSIADIRIIWGGDSTIAELRRFTLQPRASEITFADRFSLTIVDSDAYMDKYDGKKVAADFYNDTYLTDQNACTSPIIVVWTGDRKAEAKEKFWDELHSLVKKKYIFQEIQGIDKLSNGYLVAIQDKEARILEHEDNLLVRIRLSKITEQTMEIRGNSGFFLEYDCDNIMELKPLCDDARCQTIGYIGEKDMLVTLIKSGIRGIDRVVPVGKTMDFDLLWDGYNLTERLTRVISIY